MFIWSGCMLRTNEVKAGSIGRRLGPGVGDVPAGVQVLGGVHGGGRRHTQPLYKPGQHGYRQPQ